MRYGNGNSHEIVAGRDGIGVRKHDPILTHPGTDPDYSTALTISSITFLASPNTIMVLSM